MCSRTTIKLSVVAIFALLSACAGSRELLRNEMKLKGDANVTKEGLTVIARVLDEGAMAKEPRLVKTVDVARQGHVMQVPWMLLTPPVFEVKITNKTGHVVKMTGAVFKLVDAAGNLYDALPKDKAIAHEMDAADAVARQGIVVPESSKHQIAQGIKQLKVLDENTQLLPDLSDTFFLSFELPIEPTGEALSTWLATQTSLQLKIYEVPTQTNDAGAVTKRVAFEFPLVVTTYRDTYEVGLMGSKLLSSQEVAK